MAKSLEESTSGDMKDLKVQPWEEIILAMRTNIDTNVDPSENDLVQLESLVKDYRKAKSSLKD